MDLRIQNVFSNSVPKTVVYDNKYVLLLEVNSIFLFDMFSNTVLLAFKESFKHYIDTTSCIRTVRITSFNRFPFWPFFGQIFVFDPKIIL